MTDEDTVEYYKRMTDRRAYITKDIVRYDRGRYVMVNPISPEMMLEMRNTLTDEEEAAFLSDMRILESTMSSNQSA